MTVLEIALPVLKRDIKLIEELEKTLVPGLRVKLQNAGVVNGLRGFFDTENGRDVKDEFREVLLLEWPTVQHFKDFVASPPYLEFSSAVKEKFAAGPPQLKLFEVDGDVSRLFSSETVLEYHVVKPKDASEAGVQNALQHLQAGIAQFGTAKVFFGKSANLPTQEIALVGLYASDADLEAAKASDARQKLLASIADTADVTTLVAHVKKELPLPKE